MYRLAYTIMIRRTYIDENAHSFRIKEIYAYFILVQMLRGRIVQINDKSMKIGRASLAQLFKNKVRLKVLPKH